MIARNGQLGLKTWWECGHTAQDGTADAVAAQFAELPWKQVVDALDAPTLDAPTLVGPTLVAPIVMVAHDTPVGAALTQLHTAPAEMITELSDAAGHAVITQGTAALEIEAYIDGLHWQA